MNPSRFCLKTDKPYCHCWVLILQRWYGLASVKNGIKIFLKQQSCFFPDSLSMNMNATSLCSMQTKLTHSFHGKIAQTIKKRDFFSGSVFLSFEICYAQYEVFYCVAIHRTLADMFGILYIWLQIKRETLAARTLMSSTLCQRVWYLIISAMQQKLSFMVWHLGARMMMTTACSRFFKYFCYRHRFKLFLFNHNTRVDNVMLNKPKNRPWSRACDFFFL